VNEQTISPFPHQGGCPTFDNPNIKWVRTSLGVPTDLCGFGGLGSDG